MKLILLVFVYFMISQTYAVNLRVALNYKLAEPFKFEDPVMIPQFKETFSTENKFNFPPEQNQVNDDQVGQKQAAITQISNEIQKSDKLQPSVDIKAKAQNAMNNIKQNIQAKKQDQTQVTQQANASSQKKDEQIQEQVQESPKSSKVFAAQLENHLFKAESTIEKPQTQAKVEVQASTSTYTNVQAQEQAKVQTQEQAQAQTQEQAKTQTQENAQTFDPSVYTEYNMEPVAYAGISDYGKADLQNLDPDLQQQLAVGKRVYKGTDEEAGRVFDDTPQVVDNQVPLMRTNIDTLRSSRTDEKFVLWKDFPKYQDTKNYKDVNFNGLPDHVEQAVDANGNYYYIENLIENYVTPVQVGDVVTPTPAYKDNLDQRIQVHNPINNEFEEKTWDKKVSLHENK